MLKTPWTISSPWVTTYFVVSLLWTTWCLSSSSLQLSIIFVSQTVICALPQSTHTCSFPWSTSLKFLWPTILLELNTLCSVLLNKHMKRYSNSAIRWVNNKILLCNQNTECMCQLGLGVTGNLMHWGWNVHCYFHFRKPSAIYTKSELTYTLWLSNCTPGYLCTEICIICINRHIWVNGL